MENHSIEPAPLRPLRPLRPLPPAVSTFQRFNALTFRILLATILTAVTLPVQSKLININFTQNSSPGHGGPSPGPTMTGAAVLGSAGDLWNGINGTNSNGITLTNSDGTVSTVKMTFTSGGGYNAFNYSGSTPFTNTASQALMETYLYNFGVPQTITLSGLAPNAAYGVVLYNAANTGASGRTTSFTINSNTLSSTWNGTSSTFIPGVDYVYFPAAHSDGSGNMTIGWTGNGTIEADLNGLQITPAQFAITNLSRSNSVITLPTQNGFSYQVQYRTNLSQAAWTDLGNPMPGNGGVLAVSGPAAAPTAYFRVQMSTNTPPISRLQTSGTTIVNAFGQPVVLKGLNLGGWFIMEPWMCPADSGGLPDTYSIIQKLDSRFGVNTEQQLIHIYQSNWITTADLNNITNGGFNCVRVPVWWGNFYSITNTTTNGWRSDAFTMLDWVVTNCAARGIYVVIDMHGVVGGQSTSDDTGQQNLDAYWTNSLDQSETVYMWTQIASRYCTNDAIAGYDLINEPDGTTNTAAVWSAYYSLYNAIRAVDTNRILIMEGTFNNWDWNMLPPPSDFGWTNVVYSMHEYQFNGSTNQVEAGSDNQVNDFKNHLSWNVPDYIGEWNDMGNGALCYDYSISDYNNAGISWTMWAYKATQDLLPDGWGWYDPTFWPPTPNVSSDSAAKIISDWQQWQTTNCFQLNPTVGL